jgi:hypothetical protein
MKKLCTATLLILHICVYAQNGLHGYIGSNISHTDSSYGEGFGFYSAIWPLIASPIRNFQIGLPSTWITPKNSDNKTSALCPVGTYARDNWPEWGPTWDGVFQTVEGGPGYWVGNRFHYGPPKFKMNSTPSCYNEEISTPGWPFFFSDGPLADDVLGIAQLSNRILYPPDGLTFDGAPNGDFLGISYMSLPLTSAYQDTYPVGEKNWTCFLHAQNFKGPLAYYLPETWAKISKDYPTDYGRGLDTRPSSTNTSGGTMEINTVPKLTATDNSSNKYYKIPRLQFPVDSLNRTVISKDVRLYNKTALYDKVLAWKNGGTAASGTFDTLGSYVPRISTNPVDYDQDNLPVLGINELAQPKVSNFNEFGFQWAGNFVSGMRSFPEYYKDSAQYRVAIDPSKIPASAASLITASFPTPNPSPAPYEAPITGAWATPGPAAGPFYAFLKDDSKVTYYWYRFIDQPVFQQFNWTTAKKDSLQHLVESIHTNWTTTQNYMPPPTGKGELVTFDPALLVTPPAGYEKGYVPIVTKQEKGTAPTGLQKIGNDYHAATITVYPNPSASLFYISTDGEKIREVEVFDILGNRIVHSSFNESKIMINLGERAPGAYNMRITDNSEVVAYRKIFIR